MPKRPKRKKPKQIARKRKIGIDKQIEDFSEEIESIGKKTTSQYRTKRLYRSGKDKIIAGVCGGIGEYLNVDPVVIRLLWIIATLAWGFGILAYIIAWIIIPRNPKQKWNL